MTENRIAPEQIMGFARHLRQAERSPGTIENYLHHVHAFAAWLGGQAGDQGGRAGLERTPALSGLLPQQHPRHAGRAEPFP